MALLVMVSESLGHLDTFILRLDIVQVRMLASEMWFRLSYIVLNNGSGYDAHSFNS